MFRSIGYRGLPLAGIPFDDRRGLIRNEGGRVTAEAGQHECGEYVVGWIKRGPSGVIGTNKKDAADTVAKVIEDRDAGKLNEPTSDPPRTGSRSAARNWSPGRAGARSTSTSAAKARRRAARA